MQKSFLNWRHKINLMAVLMASFPTLVHFAATDYKDSFQPQHTQVSAYATICESAATRCKTTKSGLKIRRGQPRGGSTPLPAPRFKKNKSRERSTSCVI